MINEFRGKYYFLSNFYDAPVTIDGITYRNNEAAFQAMKIKDINVRNNYKIYNSKTNSYETFATVSASLAKKAGRKVALREDWEEVKFEYMYRICKAKFTQNEDLKAMLLATNDEYLEEGTTGWHDNIWGNCECPKCKNIVGQNHLGKILMKIREELR